MGNTCWAADTGDPEGFGGPAAKMLRLENPEGPIKNCVRPRYLKGLRDYACKHKHGCLHQQAEAHRPPEWDPCREAFVEADGRDPKKKLGRVPPLVRPDPAPPGKRRPVKGAAVQGKRKPGRRR